MSDASPTRRGTRLAADDWLEAGMKLLVDEGIEALKVPRLSAILGVTKGSFYWHFPDIAAMKASLRDHCRTAHEAVTADIAGLASIPPMDRIHAMGALVADPRRWRVEAALRRWADVDEAIAHSIAAMDAQILDLTVATMRELGFDDAGARARATALLYAGIGYVHTQGRIDSTGDDMRIFIDMLTRR